MTYNCYFNHTVFHGKLYLKLFHQDFNLVMQLTTDIDCVLYGKSIEIIIVRSSEFSDFDKSLMLLLLCI